LLGFNRGFTRISTNSIREDRWISAVNGAVVFGDRTPAAYHAQPFAFFLIAPTIVPKTAPAGIPIPAAIIAASRCVTVPMNTLNPRTAPIIVKIRIRLFVPQRAPEITPPIALATIQTEIASLDRDWAPANAPNRANAMQPVIALSTRLRGASGSGFGTGNDLASVFVLARDGEGFFDSEVNRVEPVGENPFAPKVLPMSPVWSVTYVSGMDLWKLVGATEFEPATLRSRTVRATKLRHAPTGTQILAQFAVPIKPNGSFGKQKRHEFHEWTLSLALN
jgi:hypothetical protein